MKTFRFDDVCINADMEHINEMTEFIFNTFSDVQVIWAVSLLVHDMSSESSSRERQRVFPKILNAHSDFKKYYEVDILGVPNLNSNVSIASHGLVHVDHRLLDKSAQEMSILVSSSILKSKIFIPPFNKWNSDTESICSKHNIELVKFEDGWMGMEYNKYIENQDKWYLHAREMKMDFFKSWFTTE